MTYTDQTSTQQERKNDRGNVLGVVKVQTPDGSAKAVLGTKRVKVNTNPIVREANTAGKFFLSFMTSIYGAQSISRTKFAVNNPTALVEDPKFGLSLKVSIACASQKQKDYYETVITKGSKIDNLFGTLTFHQEYGLQLTVQGGDLGFIHTEGAQPAADEEVPFDAPVAVDADMDGDENFAI